MRRIVHSRVRVPSQNLILVGPDGGFVSIDPRGFLAHLQKNILDVDPRH